MNAVSSVLELLASLLMVVSTQASIAGGPPVASDPGSDRNPLPFWGRVDCAEHPPPLTPVHQVIPRGGDQIPIGGALQVDQAFRRLTVYDGDDVSGERCELGLNDHREGPTAFYREGDRVLTKVSIRLPDDFKPDSPHWRSVLQMKQTQPYNNLEGGSMLELQVRDGRWLLISDWRDLWSVPARTGVWTRFAFDITYSRDPARGAIEVLADLNGDGRRDERSPRFQIDTLRREIEGAVDSGIAAGESIPSHLRVGIYQNPIFECPRSGKGCSVDVDNIRIVRR